MSAIVLAQLMLIEADVDQSLELLQHKRDDDDYDGRDDHHSHYHHRHQ